MEMPPTAFGKAEHSEDPRTFANFPLNCDSFRGTVASVLSYFLAQPKRGLVRIPFMYICLLQEYETQCGVDIFSFMYMYKLI